MRVGSKLVFVYNIFLWFIIVKKFVNFVYLVSIKDIFERFLVFFIKILRLVIFLENRIVDIWWDLIGLFML